MRVLFLGEGALNDSDRYMAAILSWCGFAFDHRPDDSSVPASWRQRRYDGFILSDYRHANFDAATSRWLTEQVHAGAGLVMIGGWASFTGLVGGYAGSRIEQILPVYCRRHDDRIQHASGVVLEPQVKTLWKLSWAQPPVVCGFHQARPKSGSKVLAHFRPLSFKNGRPRLTGRRPALVTGKAGRGRTAAFLTDCAPHWAGGLVDWGSRRVTIRIGRRTKVEVGDEYLRFFQKLLSWAFTGG